MFASAYQSLEDITITIAGGIHLLHITKQI